MRNNKYQRIYNTPYQLKLPLEIEKNNKISDPVYTFCEVLNQIDLKRYLVVKENRTGRKRFDSETLLKVILFAFMEHGYVSTREIEKLCKTDIRFMYLMNEQSAPSHMTLLPFISPYCIYIISSAPKVPSSILVFQIRMSVKYHQCTFSLEISHKLCYTYMRWNTY